MLNAGDILQLDGTVIAGVLVLLTLSAIGKRSLGEIPYFRLSVRQAVSFVIIPFSLSALTLIFNEIAEKPNDEGALYWAFIFSMLGFLYLIGTTIFVRMPDEST